MIEIHSTDQTRQLNAENPTLQAREEYVLAMKKEGKMLEPENLDERQYPALAGFFHRKNVLLFPMAKGADSEVAYYYDEEGKTSLVKVYNWQNGMAGEAIDDYALLTAAAQSKIEEISSELQHKLRFDEDEYDVEYKVASTGRVSTGDNGRVAMFYDQWEQGDNLHFRNDEIFAWPEVEAIGDVIRNSVNYVYLSGENRVAIMNEFLVALTEKLKKCLGCELLITPSNVKVRIDHQNKKIVMVITDIAANVHTTVSDHWSKMPRGIDGEGI